MVLMSESWDSHNPHGKQSGMMMMTVVFFLYTLEDKYNDSTVLLKKRAGEY